MDEERIEAWWGRHAWALPSAVRERAPLVQCITNLVFMDIAANALTTADASRPCSTASARSPTSPRAAMPSASTYLEEKP
ncbi:hypothetical protein ZWY2020_027084 [Hordeum vulgare]|nr:hypothetical protein ZWY2020_027084 [Hordeum vulgare]